MRPALNQAALFGGRLLLVAAITFGSFYALEYARHSAEGSANFRLAAIQCEGLTHLDGQAIESLVRSHVPANLLLADLEEVRGLLESQAWVKQAAVRRKLPDRLILHVLERQPAAVATVDGELYVVDAEGVVLDQHGSRFQFIDRPIVKGLQNVARENARQENALRMQVYLRVVEELEAYRESISEIDVENPNRVAVIPGEDPVHVYLGAGEFLARYETFISQLGLYERLKKQYGVIESVDVTYENKIIFHTPQDRQSVTAAVRGQS